MSYKKNGQEKNIECEINFVCQIVFFVSRTLKRGDLRWATRTS